MLGWEFLIVIMILILSARDLHLTNLICMSGFIIKLTHYYKCTLRFWTCIHSFWGDLVIVWVKLNYLVYWLPVFSELCVGCGMVTFCLGYGVLLLDVL